MKIFFGSLALAVLMFCSIPLSAHAGWTDGWTVDKIIYTPTNGVKLVLSDDYQSDVTVNADNSDADFENKVLAMCLTAKANGSKILIHSFVGGRFTNIAILD